MVFWFWFFFFFFFRTSAVNFRSKLLLKSRSLFWNTILILITPILKTNQKKIKTNQKCRERRLADVRKIVSVTIGPKPIAASLIFLLGWKKQARLVPNIREAAMCDSWAMTKSRPANTVSKFKIKSAGWFKTKAFTWSFVLISSPCWTKPVFREG